MPHHVQNQPALRAFLISESGAVAVDWVVLTAGVVGLGMATTLLVSGGVENISQDTAQSLANAEVGITFATP